jgi:multiple sugar transport system permease protein
MSTTATHTKKSFKTRNAHWFLLLPGLIYLLVFMGYPLFRGVQLSFTDTNSLTPTQGNFIGAENYSKLFTSDGFFSSIYTTLVYAISSVLGALVVGMAAALLMNESIRGKFVIRSLVTLPWAAPPIAVALIFTWMFNPQYGVVNAGLNTLGLIGRETQWLSSPTLALPALVIITVWMTFPITSLVLLAALQSIPKEIYEAATIDGSSSLKLFRYITLPLMRPTTYVMTLLLSIWALRRFDLIWVLTQGGPVDSTTTLVVRLYIESFVNGNLGYGAAIGSMGLILSIFCTVFYFIASKRLDEGK